MAIEIKVPVLPESVADATIIAWHKKPGETVARDENLVDIETDKVVLEVVAPDHGTIDKIIKNAGDRVLAQEVIATFIAKAAASTQKAAPQTEAPTVKPAATLASSVAPSASNPAKTDTVSPSVRRLVAEHELQPTNIPASGKGGRITKEDVLQYVAKQDAPTTVAAGVSVAPGARTEKRVPMSRLRARIAERLVQAQHTAAILTTFNEINMKPVMDLRQRYKDSFEKTHGARLGFMSFFVKATVEALKRYPEVNASIDGQDIVYHGYYDIGIAVSAPRGLVVPVLRDVDAMSMADIEKAIAASGEKAKNNQLTIEDISGGTFTISNGGVFGSLMATPIINPPQSGILGMHRIQDRPMAVDGQVVILPMMYVAFSYDHRIIDGRESVGFLKTIKELLEDPARLLLGV